MVPICVALKASLRHLAPFTFVSVSLAMLRAKLMVLADVVCPSLLPDILAGVQRQCHVYQPHRSTQKRSMTNQRSWPRLTNAQGSWLQLTKYHIKPNQSTSRLGLANFPCDFWQTKEYANQMPWKVTMILSPIAVWNQPEPSKGWGYSILVLAYSCQMCKALLSASSVSEYHWNASFKKKTGTAPFSIAWTVLQMQPMHWEPTKMPVAPKS